MKTVQRRALSIVLILCMVMSVLPLTALAAEGEEDVYVTQCTKNVLCVLGDGHEDGCVSEGGPLDDGENDSGDGEVEGTDEGSDLILDSVIARAFSSNMQLFANNTNEASVTSGDSTTEYSTLAEAFEKANSGDTVKLLKNVNISTQINLPSGVNLDGNNCTITFTPTYLTSKPNMIEINGSKIENPGNITIKNITLSGDKTDNGSGHGISVFEYQDLVTLENVKIENNGKSGMVVNCSNVDANGLKTSGNKWNGVNVDPGKKPSGNPKPSIFKFDEDSSFAEATQIKSDGDNVTAEYTVTVIAPEGWYKIQTGEKSYEWSTDNFAEAKITSNEIDFYCKTLALAVDAAEDNDIITLLDDISLISKITIDKSLTIDGNNHTINGSNSSSHICFEIVAGKVVIQNMTINNFGVNTAPCSGSAVILTPLTAAANTDLTVSNVEFSGFCRAGIAVYSGKFEILDCEIDCANTSINSLTKGILAGFGDNPVTGSIINTEIYSAKSTYVTWATAAIEVYANADVEITGCDIYNVETGVWVDAYWPVTKNAVANATINSSAIDAEYPIVAYHSEYYNGNQYHQGDTVTGTIVIESGYFSGPVTLYDNKGCGNASIIIKGGYFTSNPGAYVADGCVALMSDAPGYTYTVGQKSESAPTVITGAVTSSVGAGVNKEDVQDILDALGEIETPGEIAALGNSMANLLNAEDLKGEYSDEIETLIEKAGGESTVTIVVQPYIDIKISDYVEASDGNITLALNITAMYNVIATTAENLTNINTSDNAEQNAVVLDNAVMKVTDPVEITIPITNDLYDALNNSGNIYIEHQPSTEKTYYYLATLSNDNGSYTLTFTTLHGFSPFIISTNVNVVAQIGHTYYASLQDAVDDVANGGTIVLLKDCADPVFISRAVSFTLNKGNSTTGSILAGDGLQISEDNGTYTVTELDDPGTSPGSSNNNNNNNSSGSSGGTSGGSSGGSSSATYSITANSTKNGSVSVSGKSASKGDTVAITVTPDEGYELAELTVTDKDGNKVKLTDKGNGKYTFTMPGSAVSIDAKFITVLEAQEDAQAKALLPFTDVSENDWFYGAVQYAYNNGIMNGMSDSLFNPKGTATRGMVVTMLWRIAGEPAAEGDNPFTDLTQDWYVDAVIWASENGVVEGYGDGTFGPGNNVTREQIAAILCRYAKYLGLDTGAGGDLSGFGDASDVSGWAADSMGWAVDSGLITGKSGGILYPRSDATRAELATIFMRLCEEILK